MVRTVTVIPQRKKLYSVSVEQKQQRRRVAAYARVSTDSEEQLTSYEAQVDYYTKFIQKNENWEFVKVYTDEGISATNIKHRDGFNEMVKDALDGKIDLIITKSVSRFARNTIDSLVTVRELKAHNVEVYFEKENIYTFDGKGELLITIMSSLAQEESRSISENVTWGQRKRFADGKVSMPYKCFLGYEKGEDNLPHIVEKEAVVVRLIYKLFMEGKTPVGICKHLDKMEIPTPSGKNKWSQTTVMSILRNEKYKGDALLQKSFTVDFLEKKTKVNEGEVPQYYVEGSHEAIVDSEEWEMVRAEIARRRTLGRRYSGNNIFASRLICGDCGEFYGQKVWHSTDAYRKQIWRCNSKFKGESKCCTPTLDTETIKQKFMEAYNNLMPDKETVIENCNFIKNKLTDYSDIDNKLKNLNEEIAVVAELVKTCVQENAQNAQSQDDYEKRYIGLTKRYEKATAEIERLSAEKEKRINRDKELSIFIHAIASQEALMTEWNDRPWLTLLENATVYRDGKIKFLFKDGTEITV